MKFYLAGPFFNKRQVDLISKIELIMVDQCISCFSPRQQHRSGDPTISTPEQAQKVFKCNVDNIDDCTHMLAVVDWLLPPEQSIRAVKTLWSDVNQDSTQHIGPEIKLPDSGTVWEMGYAYAREIPIILFRMYDSKLNLMLTKCSEGVVTGTDQILRFLNRGKLNYLEAPRYKGGVI